MMPACPAMYSALPAVPAASRVANATRNSPTCAMVE